MGNCERYTNILGYAVGYSGKHAGKYQLLSQISDTGTESNLRAKY